MNHVVHDLNNHIAALLSFSDIVLDELPARHELRPRLQAMRTIGHRAIIRSYPDSARMAEVFDHVAQLRTLAFSVLADVTDLKSALHADLLEIATAAEQALAVLDRDAVRDTPRAA